MGSEKVKLPTKKELQNFVSNILKDVRALEKMIEGDMFEKDPIRIGAEQEMCVVNQDWKPAKVNLDLLKNINHELFTTELAQFNLEANVEPLVFKGNCLSQMDRNIQELVDLASREAEKMNNHIILTGILPTVSRLDLSMDSITPIERYKALMHAISDLRGKKDLELNIRGIDHLMVKHDSPMMEACNTGFQVHLQVTPEDFASKYNIAQAIAGPALAIATNSPMLFGRRLWHETRIALFQQSVDTRISGRHLRNKSARVMFGNKWVNDSILEIYKEDIMRFRVLLGSSLKSEDPLVELENGKIPILDSLLVHNSTVYRWNRPCYGVANGVPHLRIENRVLPSGPTVKDEMANAALWLGLMNGFDGQYKDVRKVMDFDDAKSNFLLACRGGMSSKFNWIGLDKPINASELLKKELIPIAREGLAKANVDKKDIDTYLGIIEERNEIGLNGSSWMLKSYAKLTKEVSGKEAITAITASMHHQQLEQKPVHEWRLADETDLGGWEPHSFLVEDFMETDLITVEGDDIFELVGDIMNWGKLRYVPVENQEGTLVGLVTSRILRRYLLDCYRNNKNGKNQRSALVKELMIKNPVTIAPNEPISKAIEIMKEQGVACLPVVQNDQLMGIITEQDYHKVIGRLTYKHFKVKPTQEKK
ncbi:MAG: CBS domain-containing protein [Chitinophagales bacterium]